MVVTEGKYLLDGKQIEVCERFFSGSEDGCSRFLGKFRGFLSNMTSNFRRQSLCKNEYVSLVKK